MKAIKILAVLLMITIALSGCVDRKNKPVVFVWYPNESGEDLKAARDEFGSLVTKATGRPVEHKLTTDYAIAIEALSNNNADIAWVGAIGYIEANERNKAIHPLVVNSGASGTLSDAVYFSWLIVRKGDETAYQTADGFTIDNMVGKRFSFVSSSSTSGFVVPADGIINRFKNTTEWNQLTTDDLLEGGTDKFFSEVLFGGSHQGSAVNLLSGRADVAAVCDTCIGSYIEHIGGTHNRSGAVYRVRLDATEPFHNLRGSELFVISSTPVLNAPFVVNSETLNKQEIDALRDVFTSAETAANPRVFVPRDSEFKGLLRRQSAESRFVAVEDSWFNPIRELSK